MNVSLAKKKKQRSERIGHDQQSLALKSITGHMTVPAAKTVTKLLSEKNLHIY